MAQRHRHARVLLSGAPGERAPPTKANVTCIWFKSVLLSLALLSMATICLAGIDMIVSGNRDALATHPCRLMVPAGRLQERLRDR